MDKTAAWFPPPYELADASAIQALARGEADSAQQIKALQWIIIRAAYTDEVAYWPDSDQTVFAEGRRFVGIQIKKMMILNLNTLAKAKRERE